VKLGGIEWRALALPATVVTAAVGVILWFNLIRVPSVENYLHQAHLRVLRTVGAAPDRGRRGQGCGRSPARL